MIIKLDKESTLRDSKQYFFLVLFETSFSIRKYVFEPKTKFSFWKKKNWFETFETSSPQTIYKYCDQFFNPIAVLLERHTIFILVFLRKLLKGMPPSWQHWCWVDTVRSIWWSVIDTMKKEKENQAHCHVYIIN